MQRLWSHETKLGHKYESPWGATRLISWALESSPLIDHIVPDDTDLRETGYAIVIHHVE